MPFSLGWDPESTDVLVILRASNELSQVLVQVRGRRDPQTPVGHLLTEHVGAGIQLRVRKADRCMMRGRHRFRPST